MSEDEQLIRIKLGGRSAVLPAGITGRIGKSWASGCFYESGVLKHIRSLKLEGTYIDVGMNRGNHTLFFAKMCNSEEVLSFEPYLQHIVKAEKLLELNKIRHKVKIFNLALAEKQARIDLSIRNRRTSAITVRLDDIAPKGISLIKIDVEGAEASVLRGATNTIKRDKPFLIVEIFDEFLDEMTEFIENLGYKRGRKFKSPTYEFAPINTNLKNY